MGKDKLIGYILVILSILAIIFYTILLPIQYIVDMDMSGKPFFFVENNGQFLGITWQVALMTPVFLGFIMVALITLWIGWTMATTPPPEPLDLDSLEFDNEKED